MTNPTSNFGWQMPTSTDLVTDLPADFETFGQAVDTSLADLKGGTSGQVLSKASNTDMDFTWVTSDDANAIQNAIVDAKGDLIAASAADTPARLAVGANGTTLVADSTAATGLKWAASPNFVGCSLSKAGTQSLANATNTQITFASEFFDTDGFHSTTTNTERITIPAGLGGKYLLTGQIGYLSNSTGFRNLIFYYNGSTIAANTALVPIFGGDFTFSNSCVLQLNAGDYVTMNGYQTSGGSLNVIADTFFQVTYLGA